jgi:Spy/CpxP family protein refolding chaperone
MNMKRTGLAVAVAALAASFGAGTYVVAQNTAPQDPGLERRGPGGPGGPGRVGGPGGRGGGPLAPMFLRRLNLTDAQRDQVKAIVDGAQAETRAVAERARAAHQALNEAVTAETFNEGLVRTRAEAVAAIDAEMAVARARVYSQVFQILTPEQKAEVGKMQAEMKQRGANRPARGR